MCIKPQMAQQISIVNEGCSIIDHHLNHHNATVDQNIIGSND